MRGGQHIRRVASAKRASRSEKARYSAWIIASPTHSRTPLIVHDVLRSLGSHSIRAHGRSWSQSLGGISAGFGTHRCDGRGIGAAVNVLAYTVGRDVVFGAGQYAPRNPTTQLLLAHELTSTPADRQPGQSQIHASASRPMTMKKKRRKEASSKIPRVQSGSAKHGRRRH